MKKREEKTVNIGQTRRALENRVHLIQELWTPPHLLHTKRFVSLKLLNENNVPEHTYICLILRDQESRVTNLTVCFRKNASINICKLKILEITSYFYDFL